MYYVYITTLLWQAMSHSVDDIVKFTGSWFKNNQYRSDLDVEVQKAVEKVSAEFVTALNHVLRDQTQPLQTRISELERNEQNLSLQNQKLQKEKQDMKSKYDLGKEELKSKYKKIDEDNQHLKAQDQELEMKNEEQELIIQELNMENHQLRVQNNDLKSTLTEYKQWIDHYTRDWKHGQDPHHYQHNTASNPYLIKLI